MKRLSNEMLQAIGAEVRRRREAAGLSMDELGRRADLHKNYISKLELGQIDFSISAFWSIATALECELGDLFPTRKHEITPDILAAARLLSGADPEARGAVMTLLERLPSAPRRRRTRG
jgi:transcriptional regulator with XRE-family HTH domain